MAQLRWHPFFNTWVIVAEQRQGRTYHPPADLCPLCPTPPLGEPTEIPFESYDIAVFENRWPSLQGTERVEAFFSEVFGPGPQASGVCEVICYSQDHLATLASLPLMQVRKLARVWQDRFSVLSSRSEVEYVFIFENKGAEIGVTLSHPHGQIYAYPYVPLTPALELEAEEQHFDRTGNLLWNDLLEFELVTCKGDRVIEANASFCAFIPSFARYPYEVYVVATNPLPSIAVFDSTELDDLASILHRVARRLDGLFGTSLPYIMVMHQAPTKGTRVPTRFHVEFYPPNRTADKLKYLAGSESGAGAFINDVMPELAAERLRAVRL